jgi:hypothetical protein
MSHASMQKKENKNECKKTNQKKIKSDECYESKKKSIESRKEDK